MKVLAVTTFLLALLTLTEALSCYYGRQGYEEQRSDTCNSTCFTAEIEVPEKEKVTYLGCELCEEFRVQVREFGADNLFSHSTYYSKKSPRVSRFRHGRDESQSRPISDHSS